MMFVNQVGNIVHTFADMTMGSANKNIGDAFLLVWKLPRECCRVGEKNEVQIRDLEYANIIADMAVCCMVAIDVYVYLSAELRRYSTLPKLLSRMPDYKVRLGYGLHFG